MNGQGNNGRGHFGERMYALEPDNYEKRQPIKPNSRYERGYGMKQPFSHDYYGESVLPYGGIEEMQSQKFKPIPASQSYECFAEEVSSGDFDALAKMYVPNKYMEEEPYCKQYQITGKELVLLEALDTCSSDPFFNQMKDFCGGELPTVQNIDEKIQSSSKRANELKGISSQINPYNEYFEAMCRLLLLKGDEEQKEQPSKQTQQFSMQKVTKNADIAIIK